MRHFQHVKHFQDIQKPWLELFIFLTSFDFFLPLTNAIQINTSKRVRLDECLVKHEILTLTVNNTVLMIRSPLII